MKIAIFQVYSKKAEEMLIKNGFECELSATFSCEDKDDLPDGPDTLIGLEVKRLGLVWGKDYRIIMGEEVE